MLPERDQQLVEAKAESKATRRELTKVPHGRQENSSVLLLPTKHCRGLLDDDLSSGKRYPDDLSSAKAVICPRQKPPLL
ncbi:hypothetical protein Tco_0231819 [Tanacetum coccineum]